MYVHVHVHRRFMPRGFSSYQQETILNIRNRKPCIDSHVHVYQVVLVQYFMNTMLKIPVSCHTLDNFPIISSYKYFVKISL